MKWSVCVGRWFRKPRLFGCLARRHWFVAFALLLVGFTVIVNTCGGPNRRLYPPEPNEPTHTIYVVRHDWHAGIVVRRADLPADFGSGHDDFPGARYLEIGWGDRAFYQSHEPTLALAAKAVLWPTSSVLHVVGFDAPIPEFFPTSEIIEVSLSVRGFKGLCDFVDSAYHRDQQGNPVRLGRGLYGNSHFYASRQKYSLLRTCNVWTAQALRAAGCPITPAYAVSVTNLMHQTKTFGRVVQTKR